jgi:hypothetical protein
MLHHHSRSKIVVRYPSFAQTLCFSPFRNHMPLQYIVIVSVAKPVYFCTALAPILACQNC